MTKSAQNEDIHICAGGCTQRDPNNAAIGPKSYGYLATFRTAIHISPPNFTKLTNFPQLIAR